MLVCWSNCAIAQYVDKFDFDSLVIQFENESSEVVPTYFPLIYRLADSLNQNPALHVLVRGHVCCVNRNRLAKARAKTVQRYLIQYGVDPKRISIKGMRNKIPAVNPPKDWADELLSMRVDFVFTTK